MPKKQLLVKRKSQVVTPTSTGVEEEADHTTESDPQTEAQQTQAQQTETQQTGTASPETELHVDEADGARQVSEMEDSEKESAVLFKRLATGFPGLGEHFDQVARAGVKVKVEPSKKGNFAYFDFATNTIVVADANMTEAELLDNVLFESFNAAATDTYKALDKQVDTYSLSLSDYGVRKAEVEGQVSVDYVNTLLGRFTKASDLEAVVGLAKQVPAGIATKTDRQKQDLLNQQAAKLGLTEKALRALGWAERTVPGYLEEPTPAKAQGLIADIVNSPHDVNVAKDDPLSLSSADLYTYETLQRWSPNKIAGLLNSPVPGKDQSAAAANIRSRIREDRSKFDAMTGNDVRTANQKANLYEKIVESVAAANKGNAFGPIYTRMMLSLGIKQFTGFATQ